MNAFFRIAIVAIALLLLAACVPTAPTPPPTAAPVEPTGAVGATREPRLAETRSAETRAVESTPTNTRAPASSPTNTRAASPTTSGTPIHPPAIASISVCSTHAGSAGSCPSGSFDTQRIVLAPDGSGKAINTYGGVSAASDEHSSVFPPGSLKSNGDYLFFVAAGTQLNVDIGLVVLSGGAGPDKNGQWTFDFPKADAYGQYGSGYGHIFIAPTAQGSCPTVADGNPAHQDNTLDLTYAAPGSVVIDPTGGPGNLLMLYEGVNTCVGTTGGKKPGDGAYISADVATSVDYGHTWPTYRGTDSFKFFALPAANKTQGPNAPLGAVAKSVCMGSDCAAAAPAAYGRYPVLTPPVSLATVMATGQPLSSSLSDTEPSAFVDDVTVGSAPYVYLVHGYEPGGSGDPPLANNRKSDLMLARAQLNGRSAPLNFMKWNGRAFDSPGIGGLETPILPDGPFQNCGAQNQSRTMGSISYVRASQQYLLTFVCTSPRDPAGAPGNHNGSAWFYSTSYGLADPSQWSSPQEIIGSWNEWDSSGGCPDWNGWYPTLMSLGGQPGQLSTSGYAFYLWGCLGASSTGPPPKRQFSSRAITMTLSR